MYTEQNIHELNQRIPDNYLWDGFWIDDFSNACLTVSGSFDRIYYQDITIQFFDCIFFNLPGEWRDTDVHGQLLNIADRIGFEQTQEINTLGYNVIEVKLLFGQPTVSYFVVCKEIIVTKCTDQGRDFKLMYTDPILAQESKLLNRVPLLNASAAANG
jgi:hypothetical protein